MGRQLSLLLERKDERTVALASTRERTAQSARASVDSKSYQSWWPRFPKPLNQSLCFAAPASIRTVLGGPHRELTLSLTAVVGLARVDIAIVGGPAGAMIGASTSSTRRDRPIGRRLRGEDGSTPPRDKIERPGDCGGGEALGSTAAALLSVHFTDSGGNATVRAVGLDAAACVCAGSLRLCSSSSFAIAATAGRGLETGRSFRALPGGGPLLDDATISTVSAADLKGATVWLVKTLFTHTEGNAPPAFAVAPAADAVLSPPPAGAAGAASQLTSPVLSTTPQDTV